MASGVEDFGASIDRGRVSAPALTSLRHRGPRDLFEDGVDVRVEATDVGRPDLSDATSRGLRITPSVEHDSRRPDRPFAPGDTTLPRQPLRDPQVGRLWALDITLDSTRQQISLKSGDGGPRGSTDGGEARLDVVA